MNGPGIELTGESLPELRPGLYLIGADEQLSSVLARLEQAGWATARVDLTDAHDKEAVLAAFADSLQFPDWFGRNWDALEDMLRDLAWWPSGTRGRLVALRGGSVVTADGGAVRETLLDVLESAVTHWAATSTPLVVLLHG